jgi:hypothetical protein
VGTCSNTSSNAAMFGTSESVDRGCAAQLLITKLTAAFPRIFSPLQTRPGVTYQESSTNRTTGVKSKTI